jgi:hypothetical protein
MQPKNKHTPKIELQEVQKKGALAVLEYHWLSEVATGGFSEGFTMALSVRIKALAKDMVF